MAAELVSYAPSKIEQAIEEPGPSVGVDEHAPKDERERTAVTRVAGAAGLIYVSDEHTMMLARIPSGVWKNKNPLARRDRLCKAGVRGFDSPRLHKSKRRARPQGRG
jgi:hypothetical protein